MMRLRLGLLGVFQAHLGSGRAVRLRSTKARALLAYLGVRGGQPVPREVLAALLWGDTGDVQAHQSLRQTLMAIRRALPKTGSAILEIDADTIGLNAAAVDVDVLRFERLASQATAEALTAALILYQGDLLEGFRVKEARFEDWLRGERERLRNQAGTALERLSSRALNDDTVELAIRTGLRLLTADPLLEAAHRSLMRLYLQSHRRAAALRQYQVCVDSLQRELGVQPEQATRRLYQQIIVRDLGPARASRRSPATSLRAGSSGGGRLIGRDAELATLQRALEEAWHGRGRLVTIVGEAGVGKTSLVHELAARAEARGGRVVLGRCVEGEQVLPYGPWVDVLRSEDMRRELSLGTEGGVRWYAPLAHLLPELGPVGDEPRFSSHAYRRVFEAVAHLLRTATAERPAVLVLEDIHWADELSVRLLAFLGRRCGSWPLLLVASARDEELDEGSLARRLLIENSLGRLSELLRLGPLSEHDTLQLVKHLAAARIADTVVDRLGHRIWRLSEGNPFMVVETMRALEEGTQPDAASDVPLAQRITQVIIRRLERLAEPTRRLAAVAAVIGRECDFALLQRAAGVSDSSATESVEELVRHRILHSVNEGFAFTHDCVRAVAYQQLLFPRRRLLHRAVAEAIEEVYADRLDAHVTALAAHFRDAEVWSKAVHYLRRAAAAASARGGVRDAIVDLEHALQALSHLPESRETLAEAFEIRCELWPLLFFIGELRRGFGRLREGAEFADRLDDESRRGRVHAYLTTAHNYLGEVDDAVSCGTRARAIAVRLDDARLQIVTASYLEQTYFYAGDYARAAELAAANLAALPVKWRYEYFGSTLPASVYDRYWLTVSLAQLGRFAEAARYQAEILGIAEPTHHAWTVAVAHCAAFTPHLLRGEWAAARPLVDRGFAVSRTAGADGRLNLVVMVPYMTAVSAWVLAELGEDGAASSRLREGHELLEQQATGGFVANHSWLYQALGRAALRLGRLAEAESFADRAERCTPSHLGYVAHALELGGDVAAHPDRFDGDRAAASYRRALELAGPRGMRPLIAHCHRGLGNVSRVLGRAGEASEHFGIATAMYREMGMEFSLRTLEQEQPAGSPR